MEELLKQFKYHSAQLADITVRIEDELKAYQRVPLQDKIKEAAANFIKSKGDAGVGELRAILRDLGVTSVVDIPVEKYAKFVDKIGGI